MVQTSATTRSFVSDPIHGPDVDRDFIGVGAANLLAGFAGAFPVDASPPSTAVAQETGGVSQLGALVCAALALALSLFGGDLLAHVPHAALAGVLLFVALRIVRVDVMADVWRRSASEFALVIGDDAGDRRHADRRGRRARDHALDPARRMDDDASEDGRVRAHSRAPRSGGRGARCSAAKPFRGSG